MLSEFRSRLRKRRFLKLLQAARSRKAEYYRSAMVWEGKRYGVIRVSPYYYVVKRRTFGWYPTGRKFALGVSAIKEAKSYDSHDV